VSSSDTNPLKRLETCGQAPWLDFLKRSFTAKGELKAMIERDGLKGVTSNPSIFQKAIGDSDEYTSSIADFLKENPDCSIVEIYEHLAIADIRAAADVLKPVYDETGGRDGYVSLECSPYLANDTEATVTEAMHLWETVKKPNLMVKVPATPNGVPAIRRIIAKGVNVNITLLFSIAAYEEVVEAYIAGLEDLKAAGGDVSKVGSVASFFVSRIDSAVDKTLEGVGDKATAEKLKGKVAIANAKVAYARYKALFSGPRWDALAKAGAQTQRLLWASTSVKDKALKDTLYVEALIGPDTVDTIPPATMDAFRDHGLVKAHAIEEDLDGAKAILKSLSDLGVSLQQITDDLVVDGVQQFADAFDKLFSVIAGHRRQILGDAKPRMEILPGSDETKAAFDAEMEVWRKDGLIRKLWAMDKSLWTGADEDKWGGWLDIVSQELADPALQTFAEDVKKTGFTDVVLLGMGGSSLGPEVLSETFGQIAGSPRFHMLDATDPQQVHTLDAAIKIETTLFITSSKSGGTLEPNIFTDYYLDRLAKALGPDKVGEHFVAVTDPGSPFETRAKALKFRHIFYGAPSIGGRYSVLSKFGLVPAAAMGIDVKTFLETTQEMVRACGADTPPSDNPGVQLGVALGVSASKLGRDKITIIASPGIADLGAWLEQLMAESTGKQGKGLIPLTDEPLGPIEDYASDRFFAYLELEGQADKAQEAAVDALAKAGHPVAHIKVKDTRHIGQEFFRWEIATAVAGAIIGINPFDQPDVEASKKKTSALTEDYEKTQTLPKDEPIFRENGVALYADARNAEALGRHNTLGGYLKSHFARIHSNDYAVFLAYLERNAAHTETLTEIRTFVRDKTHAATCVGFGPRFQHSTGQAYKGGPNTGVFMQITCDDPNDIPVPGHKYTFGVVKAAQARGDLEVLDERGRRTLRVHLKDVDRGLPELSKAIAEALS
jgi:transaldolase/glucose-6-phosphate isomerase